MPRDKLVCVCSLQTMCEVSSASSIQTQAGSLSAPSPPLGLAAAAFAHAFAACAPAGRLYSATMTMRRGGRPWAKGSGGCGSGCRGVVKLLSVAVGWR